MLENELNEERNFIKEMFPHLNDEIINRLFLSSKDINIVITKILDNNYDGLYLNLKDLTVNQIHQNIHKKNFFYPELFNNSFIDVKEGDKNHDYVINLYEKIKYFKNKSCICKDKRLAQFYQQEIEKLHLEIDKRNRKRVLAVLKNTLKKPEMLDLHGLYTKEALMFISDYITFFKPLEINLVTGREGHSNSLRPSVIAYLKQHNYKVVMDDSPCVKGTKKEKFRF